MRDKEKLIINNVTDNQSCIIIIVVLMQCQKLTLVTITFVLLPVTTTTLTLTVFKTPDNTEVVLHVLYAIMIMIVTMNALLHF